MHEMTFEYKVGMVWGCLKNADMVFEILLYI